jgi:6-pyruvoyl-tetrahydropterin synthase
MPFTSQIFVRQATVLDCAITHPLRGPIGKSWWVDLTWEGQLNDEGVVIDFGEAKRIAKRIIDIEFDHRLLLEPHHIVEHYKKEGQSDGRVEQNRAVVVIQDSTGKIPLFALDTYTDALCVLKAGTCLAAFEQDNLQPLAQQIAEAIQKQSPKNVSRVTVELREHEQEQEEHFFSYTHSLKKHAGNCQRFHGHSNIVEVFVDDRFSNEFSALAKRYLSDRYLVSNDYIKPSTESCFGHIQRHLNVGHEHLSWVTYEGSQGQVCVAVPNVQPLLIGDESSIENISQITLAHLLEQAPKAKLRVVAYEGLAKGSVAEWSQPISADRPDEHKEFEKRDDQVCAVFDEAQK